MHPVGEVLNLTRLGVLGDVDGAAVPGSGRGHHQHGVRGGLASQPGERGVRAERVVGVVGADLRQPSRDDDGHTGEVLRYRCASRGGVGGAVRPSWVRHQRRRVPVRGDRPAQMLGHRNVVGGADRLGVGGSVAACDRLVLRDARVVIGHGAECKRWGAHARGVECRHRAAPPDVAVNAILDSAVEAPTTAWPPAPSARLTASTR